MHFPRVVKTATLLKVASQSSKSSLIMAPSVLGKRARAPESLTGTYQNVLNATPSTNSTSQSHLPSLRASNGETKCQSSTTRTPTQNFPTMYSTRPSMVDPCNWTSWTIHFDAQLKVPEPFQHRLSTLSKQGDLYYPLPKSLTTSSPRNQSQVGRACTTKYMV